MCTNEVLKCIMLTSKLNETLRRPLIPKPKQSPHQQPKSSTRMKVYYNHRLKVMTGIEATTTFRDLIAAILISSSSSVIPSEIESDIDRYVICENMNDVEKCLDSSLNVREQLARLANERLLIGSSGMKVRHTMRLRSKIKCLPVNVVVQEDEPHELTESDTRSDVVVLEEFIGGKSLRVC